MLKKINGELDESAIDTLINLAAGYGLLMRQSTNAYFTAPISLFPTVFPKQLTESLFQTATMFNHFMYSVSLNHDFLYSALSEVIKLDDFISRLAQIAQKAPQPRIFLGLNRNDFFLDESGCYKQIEFNTCLLYTSPSPRDS